MYKRDEVRSFMPKLLGVNPYQQLGLEFGDRNALEIEKAFERKAESVTPADLLAWKILRDEYYREMLIAGFSIQEIYDAGFVIDQYEQAECKVLNFAPGSCTTPLYKVAAGLKAQPKGKKVVLLSTGAFSPVHNGHIDMLERAAARLTEAGYNVLGGYLSPSHDSYVSTKYGGTASLQAAFRVYLSQLGVSTHPWINVDPWESRYLQCDINFSSVLVRLKNYLNHYLKPREEIEVAYVFGEDNFDFLNVFLQKGIGVCVGRGKNLESKFQEIKHKENGGEVYYLPPATNSQTSSSTVRKWKMGFLPEKTEELYFRYKKEELTAYSSGLKPTKLYVIRNDSDWCLADLASFDTKSKLRTAAKTFLEELEVLVVNTFSRVILPDVPTSVKVRTYLLSEQEEFIKEWSTKENLLNLDVCTNNDKGLQFSRKFCLCDGQVRPLELIARPGFSPVVEQIEKIKPGQYTLVDDDIASGSTVNMLMGMLPEGVLVTKIRTLLDRSKTEYLRKHLLETDLEAFDVVDFRDFLFGAKGGGLVIELPNGQVARAPYSLPFVSLVTRASIPPSSELAFSKELWNLNLEFYSTVDPEIEIGKLDPDFARFCEFLGFSKEVRIIDFIKFNISQLEDYE